MELGKWTVPHGSVRFLSTIRNWLARRLRAVAVCDLCNQSCGQYSLLCSYCSDDLTRFDLTAVQGDLLNFPGTRRALPGLVCDRLISVAPYAWPYSHWISELKYQRRFELARLLADLLVERVIQGDLFREDRRPDLLLPVPLHHHRLRTRGFNQASLLASHLSRELAIPWRCDWLIRRQATDAQVGQSGGARRRNLRNAFTLADIAETYRHVAIVDDVVTTGATVSMLAKQLKQHGVEQVTVLSVCLTLPKGST